MPANRAGMRPKAGRVVVGGLVTGQGYHPVEGAVGDEHLFAFRALSLHLQYRKTAGRLGGRVKHSRRVSEWLCVSMCVYVCL